MKSFYFKLILVLLTSSLLITKVYSQTGSNDPTFNPSDKGHGDGASNGVRTTAIQSDGKIIIGGFFSRYNGTERRGIARLNADGTLDETFNPGKGANNTVNSISIQSDGKIIIGGEFTAFNGNDRNRTIVRLNTDGSLDAGFNPGTGANVRIFTTAIQSDGKIIIVGEFTAFNGNDRNRHIVRLNTDGSLDAGFNPGSGGSSAIFTTVIQSDSKIIIGGRFGSFNGRRSNGIARLNADGTLDGSFNPDTAANADIWTTALQSDGKIIIGGEFTRFNGTGINRIARLNTDGTLDATFNPGTGANRLIRLPPYKAMGRSLLGGFLLLITERQEPILPA